MAKHLHYFYRSEYQVALDHYHKARRRGDAADAYRWLKTADMHLRVADRFAEGAHVALLRETTAEKAKEKFALMMQEQLSKQNTPVDTYAALERHMAEAERRWLEENGEEDAP